MLENSRKSIPLDGLAGLKKHYKTDAVAGFAVFLLALPLSLGIAKASDFPPIMGLITAIIGGIVVSFFAGSKITIKGPAAGLIVIVAGSVAEFGQGDPILGWKLALGAMVLAGIVQIFFGILKFGKFIDFFPLSAIHGMMAAIGMIIIAKQIPILLHNDPKDSYGLSPLELLLKIPKFIETLDFKATLIGIVSLFILLIWPFITLKKIKIIPAPLIVLLFAIPFEYYVVFNETNLSNTTVQIGNLTENIAINVSFDGIYKTSIFIKYVFMFAVVGTLESLLTVKAIDFIDPYQRKSNPNKDIIAIGIGNTLTSIFGGLPMISEVARSASNVTNEAKTRWSNFFHGFFMLAFVLVATPFLELIPNAALAAMLISVGIKLTHPKIFSSVLKIGIDQFIIFLTTIFFTLYQDILIGILSGILINILIHTVKGVSFESFFSINLKLTIENQNYHFKFYKDVIFTNFISLKKKLDQIPKGNTIILDFSETHLIDHSVMENLSHFKADYDSNPKSSVQITGFENHRPFSKHPLSGRKKTTIN